MSSQTRSKHVVLLGIGHTNAHVLRKWRTNPIPGVELTCVSDFPVATYSGMLPGVLASDYTSDRMEVDLATLCAAGGATFVRQPVKGISVAERLVLFDDEPPVSFDVLSIGIGSVPTFAGVDAVDESVIAIKPMQTFLNRLESRLRAVQRQVDRRPLRIAVAGGGAAGVEIAFCLPRFVERTLEDSRIQMSLVHAGERFAEGTLPATQRTIQRELEKRNVNLYVTRSVQSVRAGLVALDDESTLEADVVLWATGACAPPLLKRLSLPTDERGFLLTDGTLRTTADAPIFAVGDSGTIQSLRTPKAGVYAVRQAPILWQNIQRLLRGDKLISYRPQRRFLKLLNTGDGRAIGEYPLGKSMGWSSHSRWMWRLKDYIDTRFIDKFQAERTSSVDVTH